MFVLSAASRSVGRPVLEGDPTLHLTPAQRALRARSRLALLGESGT
jgi:hypothetical protein